MYKEYIIHVGCFPTGPIYTCTAKTGKSNLNEEIYPPSPHWDRREHKVLTYVEYRAVSGVFQNYWPPTPLSTQRVCPPPAPKAGGTLTPGGEGGGGSFSKAPDLGLASFSIISLRARDLAKPYQIKDMQRSCADVNSPYINESAELTRGSSS